MTNPGKLPFKGNKQGVEDVTVMHQPVSMTNPLGRGGK